MLGELHIQAREQGEWLVGSASGRHALVGEETLAVLRALAGCDSLDEAYSTYSGNGGRLPRETFDSIAQRCIDTLGERARPRYQNLPVRVRLLAPMRAGAWARLLAGWFRWPLAGLGLIAVATTALQALMPSADMAAILHAPHGLGISAAAIALAVLGIVLHEFGHAAALRAMGGRPGEIGFGLYYGFLPMLYSDLSQAWRLSRRRRVLVNLGGIYLQIVYAGALLLAARAFPQTAAASIALHLAATASVMMALLQLLPLSGTDGYWVLADCLDEPALARYDASLWRRAFSSGGRARRQAIVRLSYLLLGWGLLLALLFATSRASLHMLPELFSWIAEGHADHGLTSFNGWLSVLITLLLIKRLFAQASQLLKGMSQTPEEAPSRSATERGSR